MSVIILADSANGTNLNYIHVGLCRIKPEDYLCPISKNSVE